MAVASNTCVSAFRIGMLRDFLIWVKEDLGPWGPVMLVFAYIPLTVLAVPAAVLSVGATLGATVAFVFGRTVESCSQDVMLCIGRSCVISKLRNYSQFQAVAIASERSGFKAYSFAASTRSLIAVQHVELPPFGDIGSFRGVCFGILPTTFGMVYVGTTLKDLSDVTHGWDEVSTSHQVLMSLGFVLSVILIFCITKVAKGALEKALAESAKQDKILGPSMLPIVIVADNSSLDLHKPFVISSTQENERQSLV
ncbi:hypothetical protein V6N12_053976 [Hibiscus sabdariffa]|uniref:SNARE associated Golgi protein family n=1 Tax=Hibiscus sabdariffa TaxID=183260 RepID=A0ABR2DC36_9ROSI